MRLTRHRQTLAAILVAVIATVGAAAPAGEAASVGEDHPIIQRALRDLGTYQGQCWPWVKRVVFDATGRTMGFDYREGFFEAGAVEVTAAEAGPGDVIQIAHATWTAPDADYPGLHTAIIIRNNGDGTFDAIDSNQRWDGMVRLRPGYDPFAQAARHGLRANIYRFGPSVVSGPTPGAPEGGGVFTAGDAARTNTPGDCLRLRSAPGGEIPQCLGHGTRVTVLEGPVRQLGLDWYRVATPAGEGWMAGQFLVKEGGAGANPSAQGPTRPILPFRAVVPLTAAD
jgi:hypothetical protein